MSAKKVGMVVAALALLPIGSASGQSITILNNSFEAPTLADGTNIGVDAPLTLSTNTSIIGNWTISASTLISIPLIVPARGQIENPVGAGPTGIDGVQNARLTASGVVGVGTSESFFQDLGVTFQPNARYTFSALVGQANIGQVASTYGFSLTAGGSPVATLDQSNLISLITASNQFFPDSLTFTTGNIPPSGNIGVEFFQTSVAGAAGSFLFDDAAVTFVGVPEPATIALLSCSVLAAGYGVWRRRRGRVSQLEADAEELEE